MCDSKPTVNLLANNDSVPSKFILSSRSKSSILFQNFCFVIEVKAKK